MPARGHNGGVASRREDAIRIPRPVPSLLAAFLAPALLAADARAGDLHVPSDFRRLEDALAAAVPGDRILLGRGRHRTASEIRTDGITIEGDGNARIVAGRTPAGSPGRMRITADGVTLRGLSFLRCGVSVRGDGFRVEDCSFRGYRSRGETGSVVSVVGDDAALHGNVLARSVRSSDGLHAAGEGAAVEENVVEGRIRRYGIRLGGEGAAVEGNFVEVLPGGTAVLWNGVAASLRGNVLRGGDLRLMGDGNLAEGNGISGVGAGQASLLVSGDANEVRDNAVTGGLDTGFLVVGDGNLLVGNAVAGNGSVRDDFVYGHGFVVRGSGNVLSGNVADGSLGEAFRVAGNGGYALVPDPTTGGLAWGPAPDGPGNRILDCRGTGAGVCGVVNLTVGTSVTDCTFTGNGTDVVGALPFAVFQGNTWATGGPLDPGSGTVGATEDTLGSAFLPEPPAGPPPAPAPKASPRLFLPEDFRPGPLMLAGRAHHAAVPLPAGRVLVAGGQAWDGTPLASAEIFDPEEPSFAPTGPLSSARRMHAGAVLGDGRVLVCGGYGADGRTLASAEIFDPATGTWSPAAPMAGDRARHTATLLADGRVFVAGGYANASGTLGYAASNEIYDPSTDAWSPGPAPVVPRGGHTATALPGGGVLLAGGARFAQRIAEVLDPAGSLLLRTAEDPAHHRIFHGAAATEDGRVLIAGGGAVFAEVFDPATGSFSPAGSTPVFGLATSESVYEGTLTALEDGRLLLLGGLAAGGAPGGGDLVLAMVQMWDGRAGSGLAASFALSFSLEVPRAAHAVTPLGDGRHLVTGGYGTEGESAGNERRTTILE